MSFFFLSNSPTSYDFNNIDREKQDKKVWEGDVSGSFSVKKAYECLSNYVTSSYNDVFKHLSMLKALSNVLTTTLRVLLDRLPTKMSLTERGVMISNPNYAFCHVWGRIKPTLVFGV